MIVSLRIKGRDQASKKRGCQSNQGKTKPVRTKTGQHCHGDYPFYAEAPVIGSIKCEDENENSRRKAMIPPVEQCYRTCQIHLGE